MQDKKVSPLSWVPTAYFAMGLPLILLNLVAPLMFNDFGISDAQVAFWTSLLILPWSLKPLWSPLMEMYRTKKFFVVTTQLVSGVSLALVAMALPLPDFFPYAVAIMTVIAFSGATHDIALDGVYIHELSKTQQAQYIGWQGAFYNIAKVTAMGGLVYLAGALEGYFKARFEAQSEPLAEPYAVLYAWMVIMGICGLLLLALGFYHMKMLPSRPKPENRSAEHVRAVDIRRRPARRLSGTGPRIRARGPELPAAGKARPEAAVRKGVSGIRPHRFGSGRTAPDAIWYASCSAVRWPPFRRQEDFKTVLLCKKCSIRCSSTRNGWSGTGG